MHTVKPNSADNWCVVNDIGEVVRECHTGDEACAWCSYLNGGLHPDMAAHLLREMEEDRARRTRD